MNDKNIEMTVSNNLISMQIFLLLLTLFFFPFSSWGGPLSSRLHPTSPNASSSTFTPTDQRTLIKTTEARPFAEYEDTGYLVMSHIFDFESKDTKLRIAKNLPKDVQLIIYVNSKNENTAKMLKDEYSSVIDAHRVHIVYLAQANRGFWTRDVTPIPILRRKKVGINEELLTLVDAKYHRYFAADKGLSEIFQANITQHAFFFEGGNFMPNSKGLCLTIDNDSMKTIPDSIFSKHYGCHKIVRLPFTGGIGHIDERVKFIDDTTVITDEIHYVDQLKSLGLSVTLLPRLDKPYESYVNSLIINDTIFVPTFNAKEDKDALDVYEKLNFNKVIQIDSSELADDGTGSIHCITATYPRVPLSPQKKHPNSEILL